MFLHRRGLLLAVLTVLLTITGLLQAVPTAVAAEPEPTPALESEFVGVNPVRAADTRDGTGGVSAGKVGAREVLRVPIAGWYSLPDEVAAVSLNVTVTQPDAGGHIRVYPCGQDLPLTSNLNFTAGQTVPNAVVARTGTGGEVCLYASTGTHLVVDLNGYFPTTSDYTGMTPVRAADTRDGTGVAEGRVPAGQTLTVPIAGLHGVPGNATSAAINITVTQPGAGGHVRVFPCGQDLPLASTLNFSAGQTMPNASIAALGEGGAVCLYTTAETHLLVDVAGYLTDAAYYYPVIPERLFDTRYDPEGKLPPHSSRIWFPFGEPGEFAAVVLNVTVTQPEAGGHIRVYPCERGLPLASNLNYTAGQTVANMVVAPVDRYGYVCFYTSNTTHLLADITAAFPFYEPETPAVPEPRFEATAIDTGGASGGHTCALDQDGKAWCWGFGSGGVLGTGSFVSNEMPPTPVDSPLTFTHITTGRWHSCALSTDGEVWCWGSDQHGQLGDGPDDGGIEWSPVRVVGLPERVTDVAAGGDMTCALAGAQAWCWGNGDSGALGAGPGITGDQHSPVPVVGGHTFVQIDVGDSTGGHNHACGRDRLGVAWCWGDNGSGQLGNGQDGPGADAFAPVRVAGDHIMHIATGAAATCGLDITGVAYCWGNDGRGQLGNGPGEASSNVPVAVDTQERFESIDVGGGGTVCGVTRDVDARALCWGSNKYGQVGAGYVGSPLVGGYYESSPVEVTRGLRFATVATSGGHTCGIATDGTAYCWGNGGEGQLGQVVDPYPNPYVPNPIRVEPPTA